MDEPGRDDLTASHHGKRDSYDLGLPMAWLNLPETMWWLVLPLRPSPLSFTQDQPPSILRLTHLLTQMFSLMKRRYMGPQLGICFSEDPDS